jgi:hypothetical protein
MIDLLVRVLIPLASSVAITACAFALMKRFVVNRTLLTVASAAVFPAAVAALAIYIATSGRDLHGIATALLAAISLVSLPISATTAKLLTKRYPS